MKKLSLLLISAFLFLVLMLTQHIAFAGFKVHGKTTTLTDSKPIVLAANSSGFASKRRATGKNVFIFDPSQKRWAAYDRSGRLIKTGKASGGKGYCKDLGRSCRTPRGTFSIYAKRGAGCKSSKFPLGRGGAPMPYCAFFKGGYAIHGSHNVPRYNASHGCIRVVPSAARWLHRFLHYGATVIVRSY